MNTGLRPMASDSAPHKGEAGNCRAQYVAVSRPRSRPLAP